MFLPSVICSRINKTYQTQLANPGQSTKSSRINQPCDAWSQGHINIWRYSYYSSARPRLRYLGHIVNRTHISLHLCVAWQTNSFGYRSLAVNSMCQTDRTSSHHNHLSTWQPGKRRQTHNEPQQDCDGEKQRKIEEGTDGLQVKGNISCKRT